MKAVAGVDGCPGGWICVSQQFKAKPRASVHATFESLVDALPPDAVIAVDMPIGLPERIGRAGRGPEALVRPLLGMRQSSVFSIPSRAAVYAEAGPFAEAGDWRAAHRRASAIARQTSTPPRGVSIQAFGIFAKIRELDSLLLARVDLQKRIIESHPEVAFWRLNGERPMALPKKIRNRVNPAGLEERKALLARSGFKRDFLDAKPPGGAAEDDLLDACAVMLIASRFARGEARPFPDPPGVDERGLPVAIWA